MPEILSYQSQGTAAIERPFPLYFKVLAPLAVLLFLFGFVVLHIGSPGAVRHSWEPVRLPYFAWSYHAAVPIYAAALWAATSLLLAVFRRDVESTSLAVRTGVVVGALLSVYYVGWPVALGLMNDDINAFAASGIVGMLGAAFIAWWRLYVPSRQTATAHWKSFLLGLLWLLLATVIPNAIGAGIVDGAEALLIGGLWIGCVSLCSPLLPLAMFVMAAGVLGSRRTTRATPLEPWLGPGVVTAGLTANWLLAYLLHEQIEKSGRPLCYVAAAASRGHRRFVGRQRVVVEGQVLEVNQQLLALIAGEVALHYRAPRLQRLLRWVYDRVGPRLAARIDRPWKADVAYVGLKPLEYAGRLFLKLTPRIA